MNPLLILADPCARSDFLASWLTSNLNEAYYNVGFNVAVPFTKLHTDWGNVSVKKFNGSKIRIKSTYAMFSTHLYLFLTKNVYLQIPDFPNDGVGITTVEKLLEAGKNWWFHNMQVDYSCYDKIIKFNDTYNTDCMVELFCWYNNKLPSDQQISVLEETNRLNSPSVPNHHACSIAAMILEKEQTQGLKEIERYWSLEQIYATTDKENLYNTVCNAIIPKNYGISDFYKIGINDNLAERKDDI